MAKIYVVNTADTVIGVTTLKRVSELIGTKVSKKDVESGEVDNVAYVEADLSDDMLIELGDTGQVELELNVEEAEEDTEEVEEDIEEAEDIEEVEEDMEEVEDIEEVEEVPLSNLLAKLKSNNDKLAKENPEKYGKAKKSKAKVKLEVDEDDNIVYPEKGYFKDEAHIKKYYKQLENNQLDEWLELEGLKYKPNDHAGIDRMRKCMAIKDYHFPKEPSTKKSKSKYAQYETEELLQMALDNDIEVQDAKGNMRILRMYTIMALRDAGLIE